MYSQNTKSQKAILQQQPQRNQKSKSRLHILQRTPSVIIHNPYIQQLGDRSTSKKRKQLPISFTPPILLDQNKQLLSENHQMAVMIQQKNAAIDALQGKLEHKTQTEITMFRQVQTEKKRFIQEILQHKQNTDQQITALTQEITTLQDEKKELERLYQMEVKKQELASEQQRQKELDQIRLQHQSAINLIKSENSKLKEEIERKNKQNQIKELQAKQKLAQVASKCQLLNDQIKHLQQVKRLQYAQQKMHFEGKIQKLHLQNRREKELFFMEHESQVKRLEEEIKRLRRTVQDLQTAKEDLKVTVDMEKGEREEYQQKLHYQAEANIAFMKEVSVKERQKLETLLKTELILLETTNQQQLQHLLSQNKRMEELVKLKQRQIERLLKEIDGLRQGRLQELQANQNLIRQLQSKLLTSLLQGETENEALKVKLARLRQADLTGLRQYHQHQIQLLSRNLQEKESALLSARQKHQQELRRKIEMRKSFDLEALKYKGRIIQLQNQVENLRNQLHQKQQKQQQKTQTTIQGTQRENNNKVKVQQLKLDECKHLQAIITAKDAEIEQLGQRLQMLKDNHGLERSGWQSELQAEKEQHELTKAERSRNCEAYEAEIAKLKDLLKKQKAEFGRDLQLLKEEHRGDFDAVMVQLSLQRDRNEEDKQRLLLQLKKKQLQIQKLTHQLASREQDIQTLQSSVHQQKVNTFNQQRQQLQDFYIIILKQRQAQIQDCKQRIQELTSDLRDGRQNYNDLQRRMEQLIEAQSVLREVERKVIHMGKQNNLTKNLHQIVK